MVQHIQSLVYINFVLACPVGKFGHECSQTCHCKNSKEKCDMELGMCKSGCHENWTGFDCQIRKLCLQKSIIKEVRLLAEYFFASIKNRFSWNN